MDLLAHPCSHLLIGREIVLIERIFDGNDRIVGRHVSVNVKKRVRRHDTVVLASLSAQIVGVSLGVVELRSSDVKSNHNLAFMTTVMNSLRNDLKTMIFVADLRGTKATLITDISSGFAKLLVDQRL